MKQSATPQLVAIDVRAAELVVAREHAGGLLPLAKFPNTAAGHRSLLKTSRSSAPSTRAEARLHAVGFTPDHGGVIAHDLELNIAHLKRRLKAFHSSALELVKGHPVLHAMVARLPARRALRT